MIFRVSKTKDYTVMSNYHLRDKELSLKAKGLLSVMLSLPDDWEFNMDGICSFVKEGIESVRATVSELQERGYIARQEVRESGKFKYVYNIFEKPCTEQPSTENPCTVKPSTDNHTQINTNIPITNTPITKKQNTDGNIYIAVTDILNEKAGTHYKHSTPATVRLIKARIAEGFTVEDFRTVIEKKCREWKGTDMEKYLRPETLFGSKFESYLNSQKSSAMPVNYGSAADIFKP